MNLIEWAVSPTPTFFQKLRNIGLALTAKWPSLNSFISFQNEASDFCSMPLSKDSNVSS